MIGNSGLLPAVLTVASVALLSLLTLLCLRCKRKSKIIQEERQIYNQPTFQRGGSQFAVMRSKTVTRTNQMSPPPPPPPSAAAAAPGSGEDSDLHEDDQSDYVNIDCVCGSLEDNYVKPLGESVYVNEKAFEGGPDETPGLYGNVFPSMELDNDDDDYENSDFLNHAEEATLKEHGMAGPAQGCRKGIGSFCKSFKQMWKQKKHSHQQEPTGGFTCHNNDEPDYENGECA